MHLDKVTQDYIERHPNDCAAIPITGAQKLMYIIPALVFFSLLLFRWDYLLLVLNSLFALAYFFVILFRSTSICLSLFGFGITRVSDEELAAMNDEDLPMYTILLPLYKEAGIAEKLVHNIDSLDYPAEKLDVKLLLEEDDTETVSAVRAIKNLPAYYDVIVVPDAHPKTKPKACNHGLLKAKGEFCVIFDAEDRPEPDQLKKVVHCFRNAPDNVACIQGKLNYYNSTQNTLTRWFTVEYSTNFDLVLPGLQVMGAPIPLGGTSNHFRTKLVQELDGWDPFNVTEDCDLGVRIYRKGYRTQMVDSTTWEEANCNLWNWIRQRSRWVKGYFQTHLVHTRNPLKTLFELGPWGFAGFVLCVGGTGLMFILNFIYWTMLALYGGLLAHGMIHGFSAWELIARNGEAVPNIPPAFHIGHHAIHAWPLVYYGEKQDVMWSTMSIVFFTIGCLLLLANLLFVFMHVAACIKRKRPGLLPYALTMPLYWMLISCGAWKGFIQLFTKPHYWEKTHHGLENEADDNGSTVSTPKK